MEEIKEVTLDDVNNCFRELCDRVEIAEPEKFWARDIYDAHSEYFSALLDVLIDDIRELNKTLPEEIMYIGCEKFLDVLDKANRFSGNALTVYTAIQMLILYKLGNEPGKELSFYMKNVLDGYFGGFMCMDTFVNYGYPVEVK